MKVLLPDHALFELGRDLLESNSEFSPTREKKRTKDIEKLPLEMELEAWLRFIALGETRGPLCGSHQRLADSEDIRP